MARISPEVIDRVREAANIVDVISQYLDLRKRGQNFVGICPFHNDTRPSLYVSPSKEIYKCFACGAGGNRQVRDAHDQAFAFHIGKRDIRAAVDALVGVAVDVDVV